MPTTIIPGMLITHFLVPLIYHVIRNRGPAQATLGLGSTVAAARPQTAPQPRILLLSRSFLFRVSHIAHRKEQNLEKFYFFKSTTT